MKTSRFEVVERYEIVVSRKAMDGADADFVKALEKILGKVSFESTMGSGSEGRGGVQGWRQAAGMTVLTSATSIGFLISWVRRSAILTVCR